MTFEGFDLPIQDPCFFCDAVRNGQAQDFVYETDTILARVNGRQFLDGQCVIIPRRHAPTVFDLTEAELVEIAGVSQRIGRAISMAVDAEGLLVYQNNGIASYQEVPHYHLHLVPQWKTDNPIGKFPPQIARAENLKFEKVKPKVLTMEELRDMTSRIRAHLDFP